MEQLERYKAAATWPAVAVEWDTSRGPWEATHLYDTILFILYTGVYLRINVYKRAVIS